MRSRWRDRGTDVGLDSEPQSPKRDPARPTRGAAAAVGVGLEMAVPVGLFAFLGYKGDGWLETFPVWTVVGAGLGLVVSFYTLYKRIRGLAATSTDADADPEDADTETEDADSEPPSPTKPD